MKRLLSLAAIFLGLSTAYGQNPYHLDSTFSGDGIAIITGNVNNKYRPVLVTTQGNKTVIVGYKTLVESMQVIRLNENGTPDSSFNGTGFASLQVTGTYPSMLNYCSVAATATKIYIACHWSGVSYNGIGVYCFNDNGTIDNTFGTSGLVKANIMTYTVPSNIFVQSDGKIVVAGTTADNMQINGQNVYKYGAIRLNANGYIDNTYGVGGKITCPYADFNIPHIGTEGGTIAYGAVLQPDDKLVISGYVGNGVETNTFLVRHNADGSVDNSFGTNGRKLIHEPGFMHYTKAMAIDQQKNLYVAMNIGRIYGPCDSNWVIAKLDNTGALVSTYGDAGLAYVTLPVKNDNLLRTIFGVQGDGRVIMTGQDSSLAQNFTACRLDVNGAPDNTFSNGPTVKIIRGAMDECVAVTVQSDGKIVMAGSDSLGNDGLCMRITDEYLPAGVPDVSTAANISLYPNPLNGDVFYLSTGEASKQAVVVKMYNSAGMLVSDNTYTGSTISCRFPANAATGIYYINATLQDGRARTIRMVKEN